MSYCLGTVIVYNEFGLAEIVVKPVCNTDAEINIVILGCKGSPHLSYGALEINGASECTIRAKECMKINYITRGSLTVLARKRVVSRMQLETEFSTDEQGVFALFT